MASTTSQIEFLTLPAEILIFITECADPSSHLPLAQTCKAMYEKMVPLLEQHRAARKKYEVVSDLLPSTVPDMLDVAFRGEEPSRSIELWHMRSLEFFGVRRHWNNWKAWKVDRSTGLQPPTASDELELAPPHDLESGTPELEVSKVTRRWRERVKYYIEEARKRKIIPDISVKYSMSATQAGSDAVLKGILISVLPHLKVVKFVQADMLSTMNLVPFCRSIEWALGLDVWPPGLLSLQKVAVGVPFSYGEPSIPPSVLVRLMQLPNLEEVYVRGMRIDAENQTYNEVLDSNDELVLFGNLGNLNEPERAREKARKLRTRLCLRAHSSSVRHIILDQMRDHAGTGQFMKALLKTPQSLESITIRAVEEPLAQTDEMMRVLSQYQSASLEEFLLYLQRDGADNEIQTSGYRLSILKDFNNLELVNVRWTDIIGEAPWSLGAYKDTFTPEGLVTHFVEAFPPSICILIVHASSSYTDASAERVARERKSLDDCVVALIESERYPSLEAIYLVTDRVQRGTTSGPVPEALFPRAVAAGSQHGIDVYTSASTETPAAQERDFVIFPNIQEVESAPGYELDWDFCRTTGLLQRNENIRRERGV
ncbi:unnamed protein product [Clonostachys rosea]|uniref:F-box domain-containing protein n=1 Tax=Bionectria ochroleuca TaxID=29856 RepID=A0ABY6U6F3_BIOOC|nr:unnamed protein product [Clonostachys rosea]